MIIKREKILKARRVKTELLAKWYEFPGRKLEKSETPEMALVQGCKRRDSEILSFFKSTLYKYDTGTIKEKFKKNVHDDFVWISPYDFPKFYRVIMMFVLH